MNKFIYFRLCNVVILAKPMPQSPRYGMVVAAKKSENIDLLFLLLLSTTAAWGEHITDIYITETGTSELENLSHNIIDIFIIET